MGSRSPGGWKTWGIITLALASAVLALSSAVGQGRAATGDIFAADLTAEAEVPVPGPEGATGTASLVSYSDRAEIWFELTVDGLSAGDVVTAAHIHQGEAGVAGDIVLALFTEPLDGELTGFVTGFDPDLQAQLRANPAGYYVNIHTQDYPDGAVRGQLELVSAAPTSRPTSTPSFDNLVRIVDFDFKPSTLRVQAGDTVTWVNDTEDWHTVTSAEVHAASGELFDVMLGPGETTSVTFDDQGLFDYFCRVHPRMSGTIVVQGEPSAAPTPAASELPDGAMTAARPSSGTAPVMGLVLLFLGIVTATLSMNRRRQR